MGNLHLAQVYKQLPDRHGVLVVYPDGSFAFDAGSDDPVFVRVMSRRAHNLHGAEVNLPKEGELGVVAELVGGFSVWMGSLHWQDSNQVDPDPGLELDMHDSGVLRRIRGNADSEWLHPSGLRLTVSKDGNALPDPVRKGKASPKPADAPHVNLAHPSGFAAHVDPEGALTLTLPAGGSIAIDKDGNLEAKDFESVKLQDANARFCMESFFTWAQTHTHGNGNGGSPTTGPIAAPPASGLSPTSFKGPHA